MFSTKAKKVPLRVLLRQYNTVTVDQRQQECAAQLWGKGSKKWLFFMTFAIKRGTFGRPFFNFAIESYIYMKRNFTLVPSQKYYFLVLL